MTRHELKAGLKNVATDNVGGGICDESRCVDVAPASLVKVVIARSEATKQSSSFLTFQEWIASLRSQ
ncbi:hypothetical protein HMPREF9696_02321 [Afipia clevelandensis ATCC 49720]|uniref:Uncharacterized protein n=2 Tax=Afipia clevelandensis TaxID=1034 RepID=K8P1Z9_9BRAD|nr:hypothetical protein HMPREF9696_02321 [Afipia clevelandensis ATCC 49720]